MRKNSTKFLFSAISIAAFSASAFGFPADDAAVRAAVAAGGDVHGAGSGPNYGQIVAGFFGVTGTAIQALRTRLDRRRVFRGDAVLPNNENFYMVKKLGAVTAPLGLRPEGAAQ
jgi:hypothetical protein